MKDGTPQTIASIAVIGAGTMGHGIAQVAAAAGYRLNTPLDDRERGGSVILDVPDSERIAQALIERGVIVDHRPGAGIRMAPHFYNTEAEIDRAMATLAELR